MFSKLGVQLDVLPSGCCGMAGTYGHEKEHLEESRGIWDMSWAPWFRNTSYEGRLLVTGYSCRTQAKRFAGTKPQHPAQALLALLD